MFNRFLAVLLLSLLLWGCAPSRGVYHQVEPGQTLYRISRTYGVDEQYLARLNGIADPTQLRVGQRLFIPGADRQRRVPATVSTPVEMKSGSPEPPGKPDKGTSAASVAPKPAPKPAPAPTPPVKTGSRLGKGDFDWPLRGRIVRGFGRSGDRTCNGLEIGAPEGTPVLAAAAGRVTYSGNGIRGYGHLIILRHDDSFFTVYGYNSRNLVETGTFVSKGERIALSGRSPDGGAPSLHFEIRRGKTAVDPIFYLP